MKNIDHTPVYVCSHVFNNTHPILLVSKADGDWQMLCGEEHDADEVPKVVGLGHLLERDSALYEVMDLQDNWEAERESVTSSWIKTKCSFDD
jgi:hypothetical protein